MANYLYIVADKTNAVSIRQWLGTDDLRSGRLPSGAETFYMARGADKDTRDGINVFKGYGVDYDARRLLFSGGDIAPNALQPLEGCYLRAQERDGQVTIGNDVFAQLPMIYFDAPGVVAVSDSLFVLTELRKHLGLPCRIDHEVARARSWLNGMASQQLCARTPIEGVRFAPPGTVLSINDLRLTVKQTPARELFLGGVDDYRETIREGAQRAASLIRTIAGIPGARTSLALSGGLDSRVCLAAALLSRSNIRVGSHPGNEVDLAVASALSREFGFPLNGPPQPAKETERLDPMAGWLLGCAGIYDPLHSPKVAVRDVSFAIGGHGAELYKGNFGWRPISSVAKSVPPAAAPAFRARCENGLETIGIDADDPWGSEWHYLGYRNAIHSGRSVMSSLLGSRPLLQRKLVGLSRSPLNAFAAPKKGEPSLVSDLLIALNPALAKAPFDLPKKNMKAEYVESRSRFLGQVTEAPVYEVVGKAGDVISGPPRLFLTLAKRKGFTGTFSIDRLRPLLAAAYEAAPCGLRPTHEPLMSIARNDLADPIIAAKPASMASGKLLTFLLAD